MITLPFAVSKNSCFRPILDKKLSEQQRDLPVYPIFQTPVVVSPVEGGKFAIIDGQHRTTSAAIVGYETVPCQIVIAAKEEQAAAFKAINGTTTPISIMALHAAALVASEPWAVQIAHVCACAQVELLRYPVPSDKKAPGQTMAVGAIARCLVATVLFVTVGMGSSIALKAFAASIIGGFGNVSGVPRAATRFLVSSAMS
jgi:hypothetical protein